MFFLWIRRQTINYSYLVSGFGGGETILIVFNGLLWWPGGLQCHDPSYLYIKRNINWIDLCCLPVHCPPAVATSSCIDRWSILKPWDTILITYKLAGTETCMEWDKIIRTREFKTCTGLNLKPGPGPGPSQDQELRPVSGPGPPEKAKARPVQASAQKLSRRGCNR